MPRVYSYLKHKERITEIAHVDQTLEEEVKQLKSTLKVQDDERKRGAETLKNMKSLKSKILKERD